MAQKYISVKGAREHNLKNIDIDIPREKLVVITGLSGSGKSSLAFDTIYAEGQRRYVESLSAYARQFLEMMQKPDYDTIEGLGPAISIEQKTTSKNPRSTVGTITEIYDYLRLLFARIGIPYSPATGKPITSQTSSEIIEAIQKLPNKTKLLILAPIVRGRKGEYKKELESFKKQGFQRVKIDGEMYEFDALPTLDKKLKHTIEIVVDRLVIKEGLEQRIADSVETALSICDGLLHIDELNENKQLVFSTKFACPVSGFSIDEIEPRLFSFNSPFGACPTCDGLGFKQDFDLRLIIPDETKSISEGALAPWHRKNSVNGYYVATIEKILKHFKVSASTAWSDLPKIVKDIILYGSGNLKINFNYSFKNGKGNYETEKTYEGILSILKRRWSMAEEGKYRDELSKYQTGATCETCRGKRLNEKALCIKIHDHTIVDSTAFSIRKAHEWFHDLEHHLTDKQNEIAKPILKEIKERLNFLMNVGLNYLTLDRKSGTLSGGESQRIRLASQIGSGLTGVLYVLDEPSIGLHQRDNDRLIESLRDLQTQGNTVVVVEHDESMMLAADNLVDIGPEAGTRGGRLIAEGPPDKFLKNDASLTARYLRHDESMARVSELRQPTKQGWLHLKGASLHNLQKVNLELPLRMLVGISGVSGSGKSSLISGTLVPALCNKLRQANRSAGPYLSLRGYEDLDKLIEVTQTPIGRNSRSTPSTYCGVWDLIRKVWANTRESKQRGFSSSRFSFNAGSGRCESCGGLGQQKIEMNFLPDLFVDCAACGGKRFNRQTLQVRYRDKTIADILEMPVDEALDFFANFDRISALLSSLVDVGLGYLTLGQSSSSLSGGEAQRIKLATELAKRDTGRTIYFLDEPTTGLHFADVKRLIAVLDELVSKGNTVVVIEHNLDIIRACDWVVDMGPEGGDAGGQIVASGSPDAISKMPNSHTGRFLAR